MKLQSFVSSIQKLRDGVIQSRSQFLLQLQQNDISFAINMDETESYKDALVMSLLPYEAQREMILSRPETLNLAPLLDPVALEPLKVLMCASKSPAPINDQKVCLSTSKEFYFDALTYHKYEVYGRPVYVPPATRDVTRITGSRGNYSIYTETQTIGSGYWTNVHPALCSNARRSGGRYIQTNGGCYERAGIEALAEKLARRACEKDHGLILPSSLSQTEADFEREDRLQAESHGIGRACDLTYANLVSSLENMANNACSRGDQQMIDTLLKQKLIATDVVAACGRFGNNLPPEVAKEVFEGYYSELGTRSIVKDGQLLAVSSSFDLLVPGKGGQSPLLLTIGRFEEASQPLKNLVATWAGYLKAHDTTSLAQLSYESDAFYQVFAITDLIADIDRMAYNQRERQVAKEQVTQFHQLLFSLIADEFVNTYGIDRTQANWFLTQFNNQRLGYDAGGLK